MLARRGDHFSKRLPAWMVSTGLVVLGLGALAGAAVAGGRDSGRDEPLRVVPATTTTMAPSADDIDGSTTTIAAPNETGGVPAGAPGRAGSSGTSATQPAAKTATTVRRSTATTKAPIVTTTAPQPDEEPEEDDPPLDRSRQGNRRPNST